MRRRAGSRSTAESVSVGVVAVVIGVVLAGCSPDSGDVRVLAARSLTNAFADIAAEFERANPGSSVEVSFAGTPTLVAQIDAGAPADVIASADAAQMNRVRDTARLGSEPVVFAANRLAIVVAEGNPHDVESLADLAAPDIAVAVCAVPVPCGTYTAEAFEAAGVDVEPVTREDNVRSVLTRVSLGEADVGVVYASDVAAAGAAGEPVEAVGVAAGNQPAIAYQIATLAGAGAEARAFVEFVGGSEGQAILAEYGFLPAHVAGGDHR